MPAHVTDQMNGALSLGSWCRQWQSCLEAGEPTGGATSPFPVPHSPAENSLPGPETSFRETGSAQQARPPKRKLPITRPECLPRLDPEDILLEGVLAGNSLFLKVK